MKIIIALIIIFSSANLFASRTIKVDRDRSGGTNACASCVGWDKVTEKHEDTGLFGWGSGKSTLDCKGRNTDPCAFQHMPEDLVQFDSELDVTFLETHANNQILQGIYNGNYSDQINVPNKGIYNRTISWNGTAIDEMLIEINITKVTN